MDSGLCLDDGGAKDHARREHSGFACVVERETGDTPVSSPHRPLITRLSYCRSSIAPMVTRASGRSVAWDAASASLDATCLLLTGTSPELAWKTIVSAFVPGNPS